MAQRWLNVNCAGAGAGTLSTGVIEFSALMGELGPAADAAPVSTATRGQATSLVYIDVPLRFGRISGCCIRRVRACGRLITIA
jgi:hypothetical protein